MKDKQKSFHEKLDGHIAMSQAEVRRIKRIAKPHGVTILTEQVEDGIKLIIPDSKTAK